MASDRGSPADWHSRLAKNAHRGREKMADVTRDSEVELLRQRLDALTAELVVLRAAVGRRSRLLQRQSIALAERDARIRVLELALRERGGWATAPLRAMQRLRFSLARRRPER